MGKIGSAFLLCLFAALPHLLAIEAPASQPSKKGNDQVSVSCSDPWKWDQGFESECQVETDVTTWTLRYYTEGSPRLTFKGKVKNIIVLFHPDGYNDLVHAWWDALVGPGKTIDTNKWLILSVGNPSDGNPPKTGSPILLKLDEYFKCQKAVIDHLFPERTSFVVAGGSRGGLAALVYSMRYPEDVRKSFHVAGAFYTPAKENPWWAPFMAQLKKMEKEYGPYALWVKEKKRELWVISAREDVEAIDDDFFSDPKNLQSVGLDVAATAGKTSKELREALVQMWTDSYVDNSDPHWLIAHARVWDEGMAQISPTDVAQLPKKMLFVYSAYDKITLPADVEKTADDARRFRKGVDVRLLKLNDKQGHNIAYSNDPPKEMLTAIHEFLD